jgi:N-acetylated-alpha-linked acidic dipeptidase
MADAEVLPYDFNALADTVHYYTSDVEKLLKTKQDEIRERDAELDEGVFKASNDPRHPTLAPPREDVPPHLNFAPLDNAADALTRSADRYQRALGNARAKGQLSPEAITALNQKLIEAERRLTSADGLPRRPWYHYLLFAPGVYTGYAAKTLPGVREAIEQKRWDEADQQIGVLAQALRSEAELLDSAAADLGKPAR